ncbi:MAG: hypothetical protein N2C14_07890, partial [Planctomycetales bacterium]
SSGRFPINLRAACIVLGILRRREARRYLKAFVFQPFDADFAEDYAGAFAALVELDEMEEESQRQFDSLTNEFETRGLCSKSEFDESVGLAQSAFEYWRE